MDEILAALDWTPDTEVTTQTPDAVWVLKFADGDIHTVTVIGDDITVTDTATGEVKMTGQHANCPVHSAVEYAANKIGQFLWLGIATVVSGPPVTPVQPTDPTVLLMHALGKMFGGL